MAWRLQRPLITVACNDDTSAADLTSRWRLDAHGTRWQDGPLTLAARSGATVVIHPLTDTRRMLPLDKHNEQVMAHPQFLLVASYNPGGAKELKASTRQRFCALDFHYPATETEVAIVAHAGARGALDSPGGCHHWRRAASRWLRRCRTTRRHGNHCSVCSAPAACTR